MAKVSFKKYEYEDIRTDYKELTTSPTSKIDSRTIVTLDSGAISVAGSAADVDNDEVFVLAEDVKPGDKGFVYYIVENTSNLVVVVDGGDEE